MWGMNENTKIEHYQYFSVNNLLENRITILEKTRNLLTFKALNN